MKMKLYNKIIVIIIVLLILVGFFSFILFFVIERYNILHHIYYINNITASHCLHLPIKITKICLCAIPLIFALSKLKFKFFYIFSSIISIFFIMFFVNLSSLTGESFIYNNSYKLSSDYDGRTIEVIETYDETINHIYFLERITKKKLRCIGIIDYNSSYGDVIANNNYMIYWSDEGLKFIQHKFTTSIIDIKYGEYSRVMIN